MISDLFWSLSFFLLSIFRLFIFAFMMSLPFWSLSLALYFCCLFLFNSNLYPSLEFSNWRVNSFLSIGSLLILLFDMTSNTNFFLMVEWAFKFSQLDSFEYYCHVIFNEYEFLLFFLLWYDFIYWFFSFVTSTCLFFLR